jgi:quercetin dioxygenase-like cupin family protein
VEVWRERAPSRRASSDWFTGDVWIDVVAAGEAPSRVRAYSVHFTPGARTAWHTHPNGQALYVTEGEGRAQTRGGPVETIRAGDRVWFAPGEDHWHGAGPETFMTHLAMHEASEDGADAEWGDQVSDAEYRG